MTSVGLKKVEAALALLESGQLENFAHGGVIESSLLDLPTGKVLEHRLLSNITYPYEWTPSQLHEAACFTVELQLRLLKLGFTLKDASPFNIAFEKGKAVFMDLPSIEPDEEVQGWVGLRDFFEYFLYPLLIAKYLGLHHFRFWMASLGRVKLTEAGKLLSRAPFWSASIFKYVRLPLLLARLTTILNLDRIESKLKVPAPIVESNLEAIMTTLRSLVPKAEHSFWSRYASECHYSDSARIEKHAFLESELSRMTLNGAKFNLGLDIGANTGEYSELLSRFASSVISIESDSDSADQIYKMARAKSFDVHPIVSDFTALTPALGWAGLERKSFLQRWQGKIDMTLALAVIHHLRIDANVPLAMILDQLGELSHHLIIEWVGMEDPKCKQLLRGRDPSIYQDYDYPQFINLLRDRFDIHQSCTLSNGRVLISATKKATNRKS